jgi:hypothetical protein
MHPITAKTVSVALHPALIPTYLFAIVLFLSSLVPIQILDKLAFLSLVFLLTFGLPVLSIFYFLKAKVISSVSMPTRKERIIPFLLISVLYIVITFLLLYHQPIFHLLGLIMLGISAVLVAVSVLTFTYKVSVHSAGVSGGLGILMGLQYRYQYQDFLYPILLFILLTGIVVSARLALQAHTPLELIAGIGLGFGVTFGLLIFCVTV